MFGGGQYSRTDGQCSTDDNAKKDVWIDLGGNNKK